MDTHVEMFGSLVPLKAGPFADVRLKVYVVNAGLSGCVSEVHERVLCQFCEPRWVENWARIGCFYDHVADADPSWVDCDGCALS